MAIHKSISVIIPVKNGADTLERCLKSIRLQTLFQQTEVIVLDSCSTDNSVDIAKAFGATIVNIPAGTFNHGMTRNTALQYARGFFLYFTVQDAFLAENNQLEKMLLHFTDPTVMGITGMQAVPHEKDKNPVLWFKRFSKPTVVYTQMIPHTLNQLSSNNQFDLIKEWDNVNAMYRREALESVPFAKVDFAEDKLWAKEALQNGMKIGFDPSLLVYHYHHATFKYTFKLEYTVNYHFKKYFGILPAWPSFIKLFTSNIYQLYKKKELSFYEKMYWSLHNFLRLAAYACSNILFLINGKLLSEAALEKSYHFFCNKIPQGLSKK